MSLLALVLDDATRAHLLAAIRSHRSRRAADGEGVPAGLDDFERLVLETAPSGTERHRAETAAAVPTLGHTSVPRLALSLEESAAALGLSVRRVGELARSGEIRSKLVGRRRMISVAALTDFLNDKEAKDPHAE